jgi:hypothetical protein
MSYDCPYAIADREDQIDDYQEWKDFRVNDKAKAEDMLDDFVKRFVDVVHLFQSARMDETADTTKELSELVAELNSKIMPLMNQFRSNF